MQAKWSCLTLKEGFGSDTTGGDVTYNYNYKLSTRKNRCRPRESNYYGRQKKNVFLNILDNSFQLDRTYGLSLDSEGRLRS